MVITVVVKIRIFVFLGGSFLVSAVFCIRTFHIAFIFYRVNCIFDLLTI